MDIVQNFKQYLLASKHKPSDVTIKNYLADIRKFIAWYEKFYDLNFLPANITNLIIDAYKKALFNAVTGAGEGTSSVRSCKRYLASLRKFSSFLLEEKIIFQDPFPKQVIKEIPQDPWLIKEFRTHLSNNQLSQVSIKNYLNDLNQFIHWYKTVKKTDEIENANTNFSRINKTLFEEYKLRLSADANYSPLSVNRKLSSLRKYITWLNEKKLLGETITFSNMSQLRQDDLADETDKVPEIVSLQTIALYNQSDKIPPIKAKRRFGPFRQLAACGRLINQIVDTALINPLAEIASLISYRMWSLQGKIVFQPVKRIFHEIKAREIITGSNSTNTITKSGNENRYGAKLISRWETFVTNRKSNSIKIPHNLSKGFYAPLALSLTNLPWYKKLLFHIRYSRPGWYKTYHSFPIVHYVHLAVSLVAIVIVGSTIYTIFFGTSLRQNAVLGEMSASPPPRTLAFQGKLTDATDSPITAETTLRFGIYNDPTATGSALLWQEVHDVTPNQNGYFSITLGQKDPIKQAVFSNNPNLYVGITIATSKELNPRQQLATANYAANSAAVQGLAPITQPNVGTNNVLLALDSSGNLTIGGTANPTFEASGGEFKLAGQTLTLTTVVGSNGNIQINPDGTGIIDLQKPLQNTTNNNNIPGIHGAVEVDDSFAILATTSGQSAFIINQNGIGSLISASSNGTAKFTLDTFGSGMFGGNLRINGNSLDTNATSFNLFDTNAINLSIGKSASAIAIGASSGTTTINNTLIVGQSLRLNGTLSSHLIPSSTGSYDLGSAESRWGSAYINSLIVGGDGTQSAITAAGPIASFSANTVGTAVTINNNGGGNLFSLNANGVNKLLVNQDGNIGIGNPLPAFKLDLQDSQAATVAAQIYNSDPGNNADGLLVKLGNSSNSVVAASNHFINFETAGAGIVGSIQGNGSNGISFVQNGVADFAEYFKKEPGQTIPYGSLVCINENGKVVPCDQKNTSIVGVTSEHPAFLGGQNLGDGSIAVGLTGLVKTNVSSMHGDIAPGDLISISSLPGIGVKAKEPGMIVGRAIEGYSNPDTNAIGSILISVHVSWFAPQNQITASGNVQGGETVNPTDMTTKPLALTSDITIDGKPLNQYIAETVSTQLMNSTALSLSNASTSAIARIDKDGNETLKGKLVSNSLETHDATISGTLHATTIIADTISGLDQKLATIAAMKQSPSITNNYNTYANASSSALPGMQSAPASYTNPFTMDSTLINTFADIASMSGQLASVPNLKTDIALVNQGLTVFGTSNLADVSVTGQLSIGAGFILTQNSINTIGSVLALQSLRQGDLSIMGGLVTIDTDGNLTVAGNAAFAKNVTVHGTLAAGIISPVDNSDLIVKLTEPKSSDESRTVHHGSALVVQNASGSGVLSINQIGDLIASGTGKFTQVAANGLTIVRGAQADTSVTQTTANSSAGSTIITANQKQRTIFSPFVKANSLIYLTPTSDTEGLIPYISRQSPTDTTSKINGSFTIEIPTIINKDIKINWWIVN